MNERDILEDYQLTRGDIVRITDAIRQLSKRWINDAYAEHVPVPTQLTHLIVHAFVHEVTNGADAELLREAFRRLESSNLTGEWP